MTIIPQNHSIVLGEEPLRVPPSLAIAIGLNEAIVVRQVHYWIFKNYKTASDVHFKEGRYWTYNSIEQWAEQFPFWSVRTVSRIFNKLENDGILIRKKLGKRACDNVRWVSIDYTVLDQVVAEACLDRNLGEAEEDDLAHTTRTDCPIPLGQVGSVVQDKLACTYKEQRSSTETSTTTTTTTSQDESCSGCSGDEVRTEEQDQEQESYYKSPNPPWQELEAFELEASSSQVVLKDFESWMEGDIDSDRYNPQAVISKVVEELQQCGHADAQRNCQRAWEKYVDWVHEGKSTEVKSTRPQIENKSKSERERSADDLRASALPFGHSPGMETDRSIPKADRSIPPSVISPARQRKIAMIFGLSQSATAFSQKMAGQAIDDLLQYCDTDEERAAELVKIQAELEAYGAAQQAQHDADRQATRDGKQEPVVEVLEHGDYVEARPA